MKTKKGVMMFLVVLSLFLVACAEQIPSEKQCTTDADCVPNKCCHADDSVNKDNAPDCSGVLCTAECVPKTLDCQQGKTKCIENKCTAVIK